MVISYSENMSIFNAHQNSDNQPFECLKKQGKNIPSSYSWYKESFGMLRDASNYGLRAELLHKAVEKMNS